MSTWQQKPDSEALTEVYELKVGPYTLLTWRLKQSGGQGYSVTCADEFVVARESFFPREAAERAAVVHCCELMKRLNAAVDLSS